MIFTATATPPKQVAKRDGTSLTPTLRGYCQPHAGERWCQAASGGDASTMVAFTATGCAVTSQVHGEE